MAHWLKNQSINFLRTAKFFSDPHLFCVSYGFKQCLSFLEASEGGKIK